MDFLYKFKPFNRRKDPRFQPKLVISCLLDYSDKDGQKIQCQAQVTDVSNSGALLEMGDVKFYPKNEVSMNFQLPGQQEQFTIHGRIIRTFRRKGQNFYHSGLKFVNKLEPGIKVLLDYARRYS